MLQMQGRAFVTSAGYGCCYDAVMTCLQVGAGAFTSQKSRAKEWQNGVQIWAKESSANHPPPSVISAEGAWKVYSVYFNK